MLPFGRLQTQMCKHKRSVVFNWHKCLFSEALQLLLILISLLVYKINQQSGDVQSLRISCRL